MKIKKLLLYLLFVPIMFVTLISEDCDKETDRIGRTIRLWFTPFFGEGFRCGGGAGNYEWEYVMVVYSVNGFDKKEFSRKKVGTGSYFGTTSSQWVFADVPDNGDFQIEMVSTTTKCYNDALGAEDCPSRCAKKQRIEASPVLNYWTGRDEATVYHKDVLVGPCC